MKIQPSTVTFTHTIELTDEELVCLETMTGYELTSMALSKELSENCRYQRHERTRREINDGLRATLNRVNETRKDLKFLPMRF